MKKIVITIIAFCFTFGAFAQQEPEQTKQQKETARYEQVLSAKIAFFTTAMSLTPKEAETFWPVYNKFWKEREASHRRIQVYLKVINKLLAGEKPTIDNELKKMLDLYINNISAEGVIQKKYYDEFLKILSVDQVARLYKAEEDFRMQMIHQLRGGIGEVVR
jgi:hypothetical protein